MSVWSKEELYEMLTKGAMIRWVPKSLLYEKVFGMDSRLLCVNGQTLKGLEERETALNLEQLVNEG